MDRSAMTNEENYHFDVAGYLIVPGVLTATELRGCNQALDELEPVNEGGQLKPTCLLAPACLV